MTLLTPGLPSAWVNGTSKRRTSPVNAASRFARTGAPASRSSDSNTGQAGDDGGRPLRLRGGQVRDGGGGERNNGRRDEGTGEPAAGDHGDLCGKPNGGAEGEGGPGSLSFGRHEPAGLDRRPGGIARAM